MEARRVCRERTPMMMFTMGWWLTAVHPSLKTAAASSSAISLILPMFLPSMNLSSFGISLVVKYVRCCLLGLCVPLPQLPHDLRKAVTVIGIWFAHLHLFRTPLKPQVSSAATGSPKVAQSAKQASSLVTLLRATVLRERTSQEIVGLHFGYCSMVILWQGRHRSAGLRCTW